ncbi:MAG: hypothetical protein AAGC81_11480 [Pseudomonadota bacterium]
MTDININSSSYSAFGGDMLLQEAKSDLQALRNEAGNKELSGSGAKLLATKSKKNSVAGRQQAIRNLEVLCERAAGGNARIEEALKRTLKTTIGHSAYSGQDGLKLDRADKVMDDLIAAYRISKGANASVNLQSVMPRNPKPIAKFHDDVVHIKVSSSKANGQSKHAPEMQAQKPQQMQIDPQLTAMMTKTLPPQPKVDTSLWANPAQGDQGSGSGLINPNLPPQPKVNEEAWNSTAKGPKLPNKAGEQDHSNQINPNLPPQPKVNEEAWNSTARGPELPNQAGEQDHSNQINPSLPPQPKVNEEVWNSTANGPELPDEAGEPDHPGMPNGLKLPNKPEIDKSIYASTAGYPSDVSEPVDEQEGIDEETTEAKLNPLPANMPEPQDDIDIELNALSVPDLPDDQSVFGDDSDAGLYNNDFQIDVDDEIDPPEVEDPAHAELMKADTATLSQLENAKSIPTKERPQLMVGMGQGAVGPLGQLQFYSDSFSTCSPVVLYNSETGIGGLFHVPAPRLENWKDDETQEMLPDDQVDLIYRDGVGEALKDMIELVKPDQIIVASGAFGGSNEQNQMGDAGAPVSKRNHHIQLDLQKIADNAGLNTKVELSHTKIERLTVTAKPDGKGLEIRERALKSTQDVDLLDSSGVLPDGLKDKAVVRSNVEDSDEAVLENDSKFAENAKKRELENNQNLMELNNKIQSAVDLYLDVQNHPDYWKDMDAHDAVIDDLKATLEIFKRFQGPKSGPPPKDALDAYDAATKKLQKFLDDNPKKQPNEANQKLSG